LVLSHAFGDKSWDRRVGTQKCSGKKDELLVKKKSTRFLGERVQEENERSV